MVCIADKDTYMLLNFDTGLLLNLFSFEPRTEPFIKVWIWPREMGRKGRILCC